MTEIPLPFTCGHEAYTPGAKDAHGNTKPGWAAPVPRACAWWSPTSDEPPQPPTGGNRVIRNITLIVDSSVPVDHRDRFVVDGRRFEVDGVDEDFNHGPWWAPNRLVVNLKRTEG
ncbi:hypothetical protein [Mycolicibacterium mageritense]|uniref:hypothetical protein n=1 Tax=Mycolicibacterium mageritense TaxID=53462 RepID=UPI001E2EEC31|nr:hypothetical protein [Mycolicibacterium mageritense]MCC9182570.1 hypothetical protein [Mycolicibacterium mageritense]